MSWDISALADKASEIWRRNRRDGMKTAIGIVLRERGIPSLPDTEGSLFKQIAAELGRRGAMKRKLNRARQIPPQPKVLVKKGEEVHIGRQGDLFSWRPSTTRW
ncbi:MAG: hypothetical protein HQ402_02950 [Parcubacteria group bacterium]|nr:hypothetical protein [Parcubacteria group bacterium]